jgi:hypothetical protein
MRVWIAVRQGILTPELERLLDVSVTLRHTAAAQVSLEQ